MEKIIQNAKHIEVQILADGQGQALHLGTRDCSLQRKHQKVLEIAPAQSLDPETHEAICQISREAALRLAYEGVGTIEYLVDPEGRFYFLEMNTRLQVEHTITEEITGIDLVKEQILVAAGQALSLVQDDIHFQGVAIEARLNAEDPLEDFRPSPGKISKLFLPSGGLGVRVDHGIYPNYQIPSYYDSLLAKVIVKRKNRPEAIQAMRRALNEVVVDGLTSNVEFLEYIVRDEAVLGDTYDTNYLQESLLPRFVLVNNLKVDIKGAEDHGGI